MSDESSSGSSLSVAPPIASQLAHTTIKELFSEAKLFTEFPDVLLQQLKNVTTVMNVAPEQKIITQGEVNKNLYFLLLGTVNIYVDEGLVATLSRKGDLLGEMSVITGKPATATIVAQTPVQLISIDTEEFRRITGHNTDQFDHILYRIYSTILTDKLHITNQRAKVLEETMEALRRTKTELIEINKSIESRVADRTHALGGRLEELLTNHLLPLRASLAELTVAAEDRVQGRFKKSLEQIESVSRLLQPIVLNLKSEASTKNKKVLVVDSDKKQLLLCRMALAGTGVQLFTETDATAAEEIILKESLDMLFVSSDHLPLLAKARDHFKKTKLIFMSTESIPEYLPRIQNLGLVPNIVSREPENKSQTIKNIISTVTKLSSPNIFGLEKYLNVGCEVHELVVKSSDEREVLIEKMKEYFLALGMRPSILDTVAMVTEELLMNAIYDAPIDSLGRALYNHLPRTQLVQLRPEEQGRFRFACDGESIAISVEDPFGALHAKTVLKYLEKCYAGESLNDDPEETRKKGGAGRGLHQIIENSSLVVFNISPRQRTEVIAFFKVLPGEKNAANPQFHFFEQTN